MKVSLFKGIFFIRSSERDKLFVILHRYRLSVTCKSNIRFYDTESIGFSVSLRINFTYALSRTNGYCKVIP